MDICRGCLSKELHVQTLDESVIHNLNLITNLNIKCTQDQPVLMCNECLTSLNFCIEFRDKCIASDVTLKQIISPNDMKVDTIKEEINDEFDDYLLKYEPFDGDDLNDAYGFLVQDNDQQKKKPRKSPRKPKSDIEIPKHKKFKTEDSEIFNCVLCKLCTKSYETPSKLRKHMKFVHVERKFTCDICFKRFRSKREIKLHLPYHNEEKQYKCDQCDFKSKYRGGLQLHITRRHIKDKAICKPCGRVFRTNELMEEHKLQCIHAVKLIICPVCGLTVKQLKSHLESHSDVHKYKCEKCPAKYKTRGAYTVHMNKHDGIMKQQCQYCSRKFYARSALLKHLRIHTGEKPYVCEICSKGFTGNHNLKVHMKVHGITNLIVKKNKDTENAIKIFST